MEVSIDLICPHCGQEITIDHEIEIDPQDYLNDRD